MSNSMIRKTALALVAGGLVATAAFAAGPLKITLAGGSVGGAWSAMGAAIGETIRMTTPDSSFTYEPGVDAANVQLVQSGRVQLGIAHAQMAQRGIKGAAPFKAATPDIRAVALLDPLAAVQIVVKADSPFESLAAIRDKKMPVRIALNQRGTMMAVMGEEVFNSSGISLADVAAWGGRVEYVSFNAGLDMLKNGQVDLVLNMLAFPSGQLNSIARDLPLRLLSIPAETASKLVAAEGVKPVTIPTGTYSFAEKPVETVTASVALIASSKMPDDEVAAVVTGMIKNYDYLKKAYVTFGKMEPSSLPDVAPLALHPGAIQAYRAAGLLK